ncbi:MAG: site-specific DNA-methyltransferase [Clostridia bacterium]|nr:site-specific DNA-methyltransferase [Clostridia bacterium]
MLERYMGIEREIHPSVNGIKKSEFHLGDARQVASRLLDEYQGKVQLIYLDPPFQTGKQFQVRVRVGEKEWKTGGGTLTLNGYNDDLPRDEYLQMMREVLVLSRSLLSGKGLIFVHIDWRIHPYMRLLMDEIFGEANFLNEIIWTYHSGGCARRYFPRKHDIILMYSKQKGYDLHLKDVAEPNPEGKQNHMKKHVDADGRIYRSIRSAGKVYTYYDDDPVIPGDVWTDMSHLQQRDPQRTGYDTQKPLRLLERIVKCASRPGDIVMDLFAGSGTTLEAACINERRFIGADINPLSLQTTRRRTENFGAEYVYPSSEGDPVCKARAERGVTFTRVNLDAFELENGLIERKLTGLDAVDSWAAGYLRGQCFHAFSFETRSSKRPALKGEMEIPVYEGRLMIRVSDVLGRNFYYRLILSDET